MAECVIHTSTGTSVNIGLDTCTWSVICTGKYADNNNDSTQSQWTHTQVRGRETSYALPDRRLDCGIFFQHTPITPGFICEGMYGLGKKHKQKTETCR